MNGFAGLAPYRSFFFFFLGKSVGFCFQYIGLFFFLGELACYNFILFFLDFVQKFFWAFYFYFYFYLRVFLISFKG